jgi:hypothetical protein
MPALLLALSCAKQEAPVTYEPRLALAALEPGLSTPAQGFALLAHEQTTGRFAAPLAIAKRAWNAEAGVLQLVSMLPREEAFWTEQVRGVEAVRDVRFVRPLSTRPEGDSLPALCAAADKQGAPLLLVYAQNTYGPNSAQVFGVLYESQTGRAIAALHAGRTVVDEEGAEVCPDAADGDHRDHDARYLAQREFETHVLDCLRELIHYDTRMPTTQPHEWGQPYLERWWIRHR